MASEFHAGQLLEALSSANGALLTSEAFPSVPFVTIKSAIDSLRSRDMVFCRQIDREEVHLTPEGERIVKNGSHEARVFEAVRQAVEGLKISELPVRAYNRLWRMDC